MRHVVLVTGPPCAGKTTFVRANAAAGHLIVDRDELAGSERSMAMQMQRVANMSTGSAWVIRCVPDPLDRAGLAARIRADETLVLLPDAHTLTTRAMARPHARGAVAAVRKWLAAYSPHEGDTLLTDWVAEVATPHQRCPDSSTYRPNVAF